MIKTLHKLNTGSSLDFVDLDNEIDDNLMERFIDEQGASLELVRTSLLDTEPSVHGMMQYLELGYNTHKGVYITPEHIWILIMNEIASHISANPEFYREHFTDSDEQEMISIQAGGDMLPMAEIVEELKKRVKFDLDIFHPDMQYVSNYPTSISSVKYENLSTGKNYNVFSGLLTVFTSADANLDSIYPSFGYILTEDLGDAKVKVEPIPYKDRVVEMTRVDVTADSRELSAGWCIDENPEIIIELGDSLPNHIEFPSWQTEINNCKFAETISTITRLSDIIGNLMDLDAESRTYHLNLLENHMV